MTLEVDCSALLQHEAKPRDVLVHVAARLLRRHRLLNACFTDDGVVIYEPIHVAIALDVERDDPVMVPVVRDADMKSLAEIAAESASLVERLEAHELAPEDVSDATFTIADQSALGIDGFVPILNDRQSAILALSTIRRRPVARGESVEVAPAANLAVAFDHRVLNGTTAAAFLREVRDALEAFQPDAD
jgi:pyruvate dehydrogenase E2 component (dihydrolipoamide acetyltransferase)